MEITLFLFDRADLEMVEICLQAVWQYSRGSVICWIIFHFHSVLLMQLLFRIRLVHNSGISGGLRKLLLVRFIQRRRNTHPTRRFTVL